MHRAMTVTILTLTLFFLSGATGEPEKRRLTDTRETSRLTGNEALEFTTTADTEMWNTAAVLELYKQSGWKLLDVRRIWANPNWPEGDPNTRHKGFTDLIRFQDYWYSCFRVGADHASAGDGRGGIRVIRSRDGKHWESVFFHRHENPGVDLRECKMLVTHEGKLLLLGHESYRHVSADADFKELWYRAGDETVRAQRRSLTFLSADGTNWTGPHYCEATADAWLWHGAWHGESGYAIAYAGKHSGHGAIYRTSDGHSWELLADHIFPTDAEGNHRGTEASLIIDDEEERAWMYLRDSAGIENRQLSVGTALPPYTEWSWIGLQRHFNLPGPKLLRLSDGRLIAAGRIWGRHGSHGFGDSHTAVYELDLENNRAVKIAVLPSQGDNSYPGVVEKDGVLWISYYSTHEDPNPERRRAHHQRSCIYLARLQIGGNRWHYSDRHRIVPAPPEEAE